MTKDYLLKMFTRKNAIKKAFKKRRIFLNFFQIANDSSSLSIDDILEKLAEHIMRKKEEEKEHFNIDNFAFGIAHVRAIKFYFTCSFKKLSPNRY